QPPGTSKRVHPTRQHPQRARERQRVVLALLRQCVATEGGVNSVHAELRGVHRSCIYGKSLAFKAQNRVPMIGDGGRYWDRTSDLFRVKEARYHCANRPGKTDVEVETGFEP